MPDHSCVFHGSWDCNSRPLGEILTDHRSAVSTFSGFRIRWILPGLRYDRTVEAWSLRLEPMRPFPFGLIQFDDQNPFFLAYLRRAWMSWSRPITLVPRCRYEDYRTFSFDPQVQTRAVSQPHLSPKASASHERSERAAGAVSRLFK